MKERGVSNLIVVIEGWLPRSDHLIHRHESARAMNKGIIIVPFRHVLRSAHEQIEEMQHALDRAGIDAVITDGMLVPLWSRQWQSRVIGFGIDDGIIAPHEHAEGPSFPWTSVLLRARKGS